MALLVRNAQRIGLADSTRLVCYSLSLLELFQGARKITQDRIADGCSSSSLPTYLLPARPTLMAGSSMDVRYWRAVVIDAPRPECLMELLSSMRPVVCDKILPQVLTLFLYAMDHNTTAGGDQGCAGNLERWRHLVYKAIKPPEGVTLEVKQRRFVRSVGKDWELVCVHVDITRCQYM